MKHRYPALASLQTALAIAISFSAADAQAVIVERGLSSTATGLCQPAMPVYDGLIRKRPMGVQNQGETSAFVTCSLTSSGADKEVWVQFASIDGAAHEVSCSGVVGAAGNVWGNEIVVKQVSIPEDGFLKTLSWNGQDFDGVNGGPPSPYFVSDFSISCNVPPGVVIGKAVIIYDDEDLTEEEI